MTAKTVSRGGAAPSSPLTRNVPFFLTLLTLLLFLFIRIGFREIPIERDEGSYVYMGQLMTQGGAPYRDFYEMKPPALFASYAILYLVSGGDIGIMHVWMAVLLALGGLMLFGLLRMWLSDGAGWFAAMAWAVLAMTPYASGFSIQAEHLVAVFAVAGLFTLTKGVREQASWWILAGGFLLSWGVLVKQNGVFFALLGVLLIPLFHWSENRTQWRGNTLRNGAWFIAGALIPVAGFLVMMLIQGTLSDFWFWIVEYPRTYTSQIDWNFGQQLLENSLKKLTSGYSVFWYAGIAGMIGIWTARISPYKKWMVTGMMVAGFLTVTPGMRFYGHYFLAFFPALAACSGAAVFALEDLFGRWAPGIRAWIAPMAGAMVLLITLATHESYYFRPQFNRILRETYGSNPFPESRELADDLLKVYQKGDGLVVLGSEPQIYAYTKADCPTRHHFFSFLIKNHPREKEWQKEVIDDLRAKPPKYAVWVQHPLSWLPAPGADQTVINWCWGLVRQRYTPIAWYEQTDNRSYKVVRGPEAAEYEPTGKQYLILYQRNEAQVRPVQ